MARNINKTIAKMVIATQVASDSGKYISELYNYIKGDSLFDIAHEGGYTFKDYGVKEAIYLINSTRSEWNYFIEKNAQKRPDGSFIVYFYTKMYGKKYQISFHTFLTGQLKNVPVGKPTHWDKGDSRQNCLKIAHILGFAPEVTK